jgi:diacylglycerol kinase family enzyme
MDAGARRQTFVRLAAQAERLVVVGGDGTLREAAATLHHRGIACELALVPMGNANVLARELDIPQDPAGAVRLLLTGRPRTLDAGRITAEDGGTAEVFFLAMVEIGFGASVVHRVHRWRRRPLDRAYRFWGDLLYAVAGARTLLDGQRPAFQVRIDGRPLPDKCRGAVIANTRTYAKGWSMIPEALSADGRLDFCGRRRDDTATLVRTYASARRRRQTSAPAIYRRRGRRLTISAERPLCLQADGDPLTPCTRLAVDVIAGAVRIVAPAAHTTAIGCIPTITP